MIDATSLWFTIRPDSMRKAAVTRDWFLTTPSRQQVQQLHTLIDRRHKTASTIYCTQLPPDQWHDRMDEKILADAIVDRIVTNAHATVLHCDDSMRKHFTQID